MKNYKLIILGPQCSGKTTLTKFLRSENPDLPILEEDELFMELNGGEYPQDIEYKEKTIRPKLEEKIIVIQNFLKNSNLRVLRLFNLFLKWMNSKKGTRRG